MPTTIADICEVIIRWAEENMKEGRPVQFHGSFIVFRGDKDFEVVDDRLLAYGIRGALLAVLEETTKAIEEEKEDHIDWNWKGGDENGGEVLQR